MHPGDRMPSARGTAKIDREVSETMVELTVDHFKPATLFGGDFNTYVAWIVSPDRVQNAGEIVLDGATAAVQFQAPQEPFGIIVTAEPHFLVHTPSRFLI